MDLDKKKGQRKPGTRKEKAPFTSVFVLWERKEAVITTGFGDQAAPNPTDPMVLLQLVTTSLT